VSETSRYPLGVDCVWLAHTRRGEVGAFITAGTGPIPIDVLNRVNVETLETEILRDLSSVTRPLVLKSVPRPQSYEELSCRGLFVYDWIAKTQTYEWVALPDTSLDVAALPERLKEASFPLPIDMFDGARKIPGAALIA